MLRIDGTSKCRTRLRLHSLRLSCLSPCSARDQPRRKCPLYRQLAPHRVQTYALSIHPLYPCSHPRLWSLEPIASPLFVDASFATCGSNVGETRGIHRFMEQPPQEGRPRIRMITQLLREILDSLRDDIETLGMEEVMTEGEEVPDPV